MKRRILVGAVMLLGVLVYRLPAQDFGAELDQEFNQSLENMDESWKQTNTLLDLEWLAMQKQANEEWERTRQELERKWAQALASTNKEWVAYDQTQDTRSRVNFETGEIEITTLVSLKEVEQIPKSARTKRWSASLKLRSDSSSEQS